MDIGVKSIEQRVKENIKNYNINNLLTAENVEKKIKTLSALTGAELYITDRHGTKFVSVGDFDNFEPDVVENPGEKLRVAGRTIGHAYIKYNKVPEENLEIVEKAVKQDLMILTAFAEEFYLHKEYAFYSDALEEKVVDESYRTKQIEKEDLLTGVFNNVYFIDRMRVLDRSEIVPVALLNCNINDCKFFNDTYGEEESDRMIAAVAEILKEEAKPEYIIGRCDGDVFNILISVPEEDEAEQYAVRVQERCEAFEDPRLAPSVAFGIVYKQNVEERLNMLLSDAEYAMFENKLEMKQRPGYEERKKKGLA